MKKSILHYPRIKFIALHSMSWLGIASLIFLTQPPISNRDPLSQFHLQFSRLQVAGLIYLIILFYANSYLLIPRLLHQKRVFIFILIQVTLSALLIIVENSYFNHFMQRVQWPAQAFPPPFMSQDFRTGVEKPLFRLPYGMLIIPILMTVTASIVYRFITDSLRRENRRKEEKMATLTSELQLLKSQVSPHFLFNVLNNLTYLARKKSEILEPALIKLSSLMRYMLYDTDGEKVLLEQEIRYLKDYIDLQRIRHQDLKVNSFYNNDNEQLRIAPMLLIPFVENAFKHAGAFVDDHSFIKIELSTQQNKLYFSVWNKYTCSKPEQMDKASGIGLANVRKRLMLIYPELHALTIEKRDDVYMVSLHISLDNLI
jgi:two-component system, LytTR family, sensor kinase